VSTSIVFKVASAIPVVLFWYYVLAYVILLGWELLSLIGSSQIRTVLLPMMVTLSRHLPNKVQPLINSSRSFHVPQKAVFQNEKVNVAYMVGAD